MLQMGRNKTGPIGMDVRNNHKKVRLFFLFRKELSGKV